MSLLAEVVAQEVGWVYTGLYFGSLNGCEMCISGIDIPYKCLEFTAIHRQKSFMLLGGTHGF